MPAITQAEAIAKLTKEVEEKFSSWDLLEVNNEVFLDSRTTIEEVERNPQPFAERLVKHLHSGAAEDYLVFLWHLICPRDRRVWYNELEDKYYYNENSEYEAAYGDHAGM